MVFHRHFPWGITLFIDQVSGWSENRTRKQVSNDVFEAGGLALRKLKKKSSGWGCARDFFLMKRGNESSSRCGRGDRKFKVVRAFPKVNFKTSASSRVFALRITSFCGKKRFEKVDSQVFSTLPPRGWFSLYVWGSFTCFMGDLIGAKLGGEEKNSDSSEEFLSLLAGWSLSWSHASKSRWAIQVTMFRLWFG